MNNREEILSKLMDDDARVQYDDKDGDRIYAIAASFAETGTALMENLARYKEALEAPVNENSADAMKEARYNLVYSWTMAQAAVSKIAWGLRIDGDDAFKTAVEATAAGDFEPDLSRF